MLTKKESTHPKRLGALDDKDEAQAVRSVEWQFQTIDDDD